MANRGMLSPVIRPSSDWWDLWDIPARIADQHFGVGISGDELVPAPFNPFYLRPRRQLIRQLSERAHPMAGVSEIRNEGNEFRVQLDVSHFTPEELTVKAVDDNAIVIEGKHEEKQDEHGFVSRQFTRKYVLPKDCEVQKIVSSLTPEGILVVTAPKKAIEPPPKANETPIPITVCASPPPPLVSPQPAAPAAPLP
ncbi:protein lethal(2)essential for life-like protein [Leptotrombidium deliense]|uniref:Protein lethal(2)essential for life-like protein n=1 Tax=Leptotrombidium deliense TaxID=299467 RepID=A0A443RZX1_9ACAR|nr:protein lethal(2)essential for life-like protein [Leptotrombidium deliense]